MEPLAADSSPLAGLLTLLPRSVEAALVSQWLERSLGFVLVAARLAGLSLYFPALLHSVSWTVRSALVLLLALVLWPGAAPLQIDNHSLVGAAGLVAGELVLGALLSLAAAIALGGVRLAGELVDQQLGLTITEGLALGGPGGAGIAGTLFRSLSVLVFLQLGGHLLVVRACAETFRAIPPGTFGTTAGLEQVVLELVQQSFVLALRLAAPVWGATAVVALGWGIIGRAVPALGGMSVGAPLRAGVGLLALSWALPTVADLIAEAVPGNVGRIVEEVTHDHSAAGSGGETHRR